MDRLDYGGVGKPLKENVVSRISSRFQNCRAMYKRSQPFGDGRYPCAHKYLRDFSCLAAIASERSLKEQSLISSFCRLGHPFENCRSPSSDSPTHPRSIHLMLALYCPIQPSPMSVNPPGTANLQKAVGGKSRALIELENLKQIATRGDVAAPVLRDEAEHGGAWLALELE
nr:hypothetical protein Iba_chr05eCG15510 [Ipomoea batatas]